MMGLCLNGEHVRYFQNWIGGIWNIFMFDLNCKLCSFCHTHIRGYAQAVFLFGNFFKSVIYIYPNYNIYRESCQERYDDFFIQNWKFV